MNSSSYNPGNRAREFLPGNRKLPDCGESVPRVPIKGPSGTGCFLCGYTEGIKAQAGRFLTVTYPAWAFLFAIKLGGVVMQVAIIMGSDSDWPKLKKAWQLLREFGIDVTVRVLSAHRTPADCVQFVQQAEKAGVQIFIAAAGLAAHLPGVVAAHTRRPVIGVPLTAGSLQGLDALYSVVQMPPGVPVATVGIDNARNAALLAVQILTLGDALLADKLEEYCKEQRRLVLAKSQKLQAELEAEA